MVFEFVLAFFLYCFACYMSYWQVLKDSVWFYPVGLLNALIANAIWLYIVSSTSDRSQVFKYGFTWDGMRMMAYMIIPILLLGVQLTPQKIFAALMIVGGMVILYL